MNNLLLKIFLYSHILNGLLLQSHNLKSQDPIKFKLRNELSEQHKSALNNYFKILDTTQIDIESAKIYNAISKLYFKASLYQKNPRYDSIYYFASKALSLAKDKKGDHAINEYLKALNNVGNSYRKAGDYPTALIYFFKNLYTIDKLPNPEDFFNCRQEATTNIALIYEAQENYLSAIELYLSFLKYVDKKQIDSKKISSFVFIKLAGFYRETHRLAEALSHANKGLAIAIKNQENSHIALAYLELSAVKTKLKEYKGAELLLAKAFKLLEDSNDMVLLSKYYYLKSLLANQTGNLQQAIYYANSAFNLLQKGRITKYKISVGKLLATAYKKAGKFEESLRFLEKTIALKDSLTDNEEINKTLLFEINQREKSLSLARKEKELQQANSSVKNMIILIIFSLSIVITFFSVRIYKDRQNKLRLLKQIEEKNEKLKELNIAKSRFFTNITHELKTPLTLIYSPLLELIENNQENFQENTLKILHIMKRNTKKLKKMVHDILSLASLESGEIELDEQAVEIHDFMHKIASGIDGLNLKKHNLNYTQTINLSNPTWLLLDEEKLEQIITNLLSNALKFTRTDGEILLTVNKTGEYLTIKVKDTGKGISEKDLPHILDRFYRVKTNEAFYKNGTGIGLDLCRELVGIMKGSLTVQSKLNHGSIFKLTIPYNKIDAVKGTLKQPTKFIPEKKAAPKKSTNHKHTILVVEDHPDMSRFIADMLSKEYNIGLALNGLEALEVLKKEKIDLIISDIMMPKMDGYQLLNRVKDNDDYRSIPVLMLTALTNEANKLKALTLGVDDYIIKPFSPKELMARIKNLIIHRKNRSKWQEKEQYSHNKKTIALQEPNGFISKADIAWIKMVEQKLVKELDNDNFLLRNLANEFNLSERQFQRKIKKITGLSPKQYQQEIALQRARKLLESQQYENATAVAISVGINNVTRFSMQYEARFGKTPSEYFQ
jgi:signal transduction histidine kinase/DNA-binding response OmpR family regulator